MYTYKVVNVELGQIKPGARVAWWRGKDEVWNKDARRVCKEMNLGRNVELAWIIWEDCFRKEGGYAIVESEDIITIDPSWGEVSP